MGRPEVEHPGQAGGHRFSFYPSRVPAVEKGRRRGSWGSHGPKTAAPLEFFVRKRGLSVTMYMMLPVGLAHESVRFPVTK